VAVALTTNAFAANTTATITVALGMTPEQIQERSTTKVPWQFVRIGESRSGFALVTWPHRLIYQDETVRLVFPSAGNRRSMPTSLTAEDVLVLVSVSALGQYVDLKAAVAESKRLLAEVQAQGFDYAPEDPAKSAYSKFLLARANVFAKPRPPRTVASFEEMEAVFLNSAFYLQELVVFRLRKGELDVGLRVTNMRRRHTEARYSTTEPILTESQRADLEPMVMNWSALEKERSYYLEVSIARSVGYHAAKARTPQ